MAKAARGMELLLYKQELISAGNFLSGNKAVGGHIISPTVEVCIVMNGLGK